jgi:quinol monooxygenase YgiN
MPENSEIMALAIIEASAGKEQECLLLLDEFYAVLRRKGYSRDLLYRDEKNPHRFVNIRYWGSRESAAEAHEDPDIHRFWKRLGEIAEVTAAFERLEDVTPREKRGAGRE